MKKIHFVTSSGRDNTDEYWANSACGLDDNSEVDWHGDKDLSKTTCKKCLKKTKQKTAKGKS